MARYKKIKDRIEQSYNSLPKNQQKIADFYLENFDRIPFLNVQRVSEATHASSASTVRFAQRIGFKGFSELRDEIAATLQTHLNGKSIFPLFDDSKLKQDILTSVANQDISNINKTINANERENFDKVIDLILSSERIFTLGLGISHLLAKIISYQLTQVGFFSNTFTNNQSTFLEQILFMDEDDLLIALSFPPYSKATIEAANFAKARKLKVVAITNKKSSPITFSSDVSLIVSSENMLYTNSFAAISVLINALATGCALKNKSKASQMLKDFKEVVKLQDNIIE